MEGQGSNGNTKDHQANENNQFKLEALECESEEWMEQCRAILNSDESINFQDLFSGGGMLPTPRNGNNETELLPQMNPELSPAGSQSNDVNRGKKVIINLKEDIEDDANNAMRQSYKRKLLDGSSHQMFQGETSRAAVRKEVSQEEINMVNRQANFIMDQQNVQVQTVQTQNGAGNATLVNARTVPLMHQNSSEMVQGWAPQRSIQVLYSPVALGNRPTQPTPYYQTAHVLIRPNMLVPPPVQIPAPYHPVYYSTDAQPICQVNWSSNFNNPINDAPTPGIQMGNTPNMVNQMFPGNVASSSINPHAAPHAYGPSNFPWNPQGHFVDQFPWAVRPTHAVNYQVEPWRPPYVGPVPTTSVVRPIEVSAAPQNDILWPEATIATLREAGLAPDVALNLMAVTERVRLLHEIQNALRLLRGNQGQVRQPNFLVIRHGDAHGEMHLDVDALSHEQLLALQQSMGTVSTGLAADAIDARLQSRKYRTAAFGSPSKNPACCICQEEYVDGDDTAKLLCGHYFHFNCIKRWIMEKNNCPICKHTALNV